MSRTSTRLAATVTVFAVLAFAGLFGGCGDNVRTLESPDSGSTTPFVTPDATTPPLDANELVQYCPSDKCPTGLTTCPDSHFPCDVDLRTDRNNCGACGFACPAPTFAELYECVEGRCVLSCHVNSRRLDCNGLPDDGCETNAINDDHCGACGNKCSDPEKPCVARTPFGNIGCGCFGQDIYCEQSAPWCIDGQTSDQNCGRCYNACDPTNGGATMYPNSYYGCIEGECGHLKCAPEHGDCDHVIENGCETTLLDRENCGACGNICPDSQECRRNKYGQPQCMCGKGLTFCPMYCSNGVCQGDCYDLATDVDNCGSCHSSCDDPTASFPSPYSEGVCSFGTCKRKCNTGRADCNGNIDDDCETNTNNDPQNCGGCGIVCDAIAGQACVGGRCVVEPCSQDAGETTR